MSGHRNVFGGFARLYRLDVHKERSNSFFELNTYYKKNNLVHCSYSCFAELIIDANRLKVNFFSFFISAVIS